MRTLASFARSLPLSTGLKPARVDAGPIGVFSVENPRTEPACHLPSPPPMPMHSLLVRTAVAYGKTTPALVKRSLVVALLDAARALDLGALLLIRRLRGRLEEVKRRAAISAVPLPPRTPRHG